MIKKLIFGTLALSFALTATVAMAEARNALPAPRPGNLRDRMGAEENRNASEGTSMMRGEMRGEKNAMGAERNRNDSGSASMVDSTCAKAAVDVRKTAVLASYKTFTDSLTSNLSTREDAIKASFDQTTKKARADARKTARDNFRKSVRSSAETLKTSERATLTTYRNSIKACGGNGAEAGGEDSDGNFIESIK